MLRLRTFGGLSVENAVFVGGAAARRRPLALLALLAVDGTRGMTRDKVVGFLWPDSDDERARNSLSQALTSFKRELGVDQIVIGTAELRLNPQVITSDVQEFTRLLDADDVERAVALYAGPFLDGVFLKAAPEFERWVEQERRRLHQLRSDALEQLAADAGARGDHVSCARWWRQRTEAEPLDSRAALRLMQALSASGDSPGALQHFRVHESLLRAELGIEPEPLLVALATELRHGNGARAGSGSPIPHGISPRIASPAVDSSSALGGGHGSAATDLAATSAGPVPIGDEASRTARRSTGKAKLRWTIGVALVLAVSAGAAVVALLNRRNAPLVVGRTTLITRSPNELHFDASISPNGKFVAYAAGIPGQMRIFVRQVSGSAALLLSKGLPGNHRWPRWSPDGETIAFQVASNRPGLTAGRIYVVPAIGGVPQVVVERGAWPAWSPDGKQLAYIGSGGVWIAPVAGGSGKLIDSVANATSPTWSPDGRRIAYVGNNSAGYLGSDYGATSRTSIWVIDAVGLAKRRVLAADHLHHSPAWSPDGRSLFFVSDRDGPNDVYRVRVGTDSTAGAMERLTTGADVFTFTLSGDGSRMAYSTLRLRTNIWMAPLADGETPFASAHPVTTEKQNVESFSISHDGRWLAYDSDRDSDGHIHIFKIAFDGKTTVGEPIRLTNQPADDFDPRWSPGDSEITFHRNVRDDRDVFVVRADGRNEQHVTDAAGQEYHPDWSPDGHRIVYSVPPSRTDSGWKFFIVTREPGGRWSSSQRLNDPRARNLGPIVRWSPRGDEFVFPRDGVSLLPLNGGASRTVVERRQVNDDRIASVYWGRDARSVYFQSRDSNRVISFWRVSLPAGTPQRVLQLSDPMLQGRAVFFDVDDKSLFVPITSGEADILVASLMRR